MKKLKLLFVILTLCAGIAIGACGTASANTESQNPMKILYHDENDGLRVYVVVDKDTGANYVVAYNSMGIALSPRYGSEGDIYHSK